MSLRTRISKTLSIYLLAAITSALLLGIGDQAAAREGAPPRIKASNVAKLRTMVGQNVVILGKIASTHESKNSGSNYLNFFGNAVSIVCPKEVVSKFTDGKPAVTYRDKYVEVAGKLENYKGKLQIKLTAPEHLKIGDPNAPTEKVELKQIGATSWESPAGLKFKGRDPAGLTRVQHILRHAQDLPDRDGAHGVFLGGEDAVFAVIDQAWKIAQKKKQKPVVEGKRSFYLIPMGKKVGYLGGKLGNSQRRPSLTNIFIVVETGTSNVVTAFPK